jgi:two-component system sensor histidine kinase KdpD
LAGYALAAVPAPVLTLLAGLRGRLSLTTDALTFLVTVIAVALAGGLAPSALESIAGSLLFGFCLIVPVHNSAITAVSNPAALGVFAAVALMVSILVGNAVRHGKQAARAIAESELLAAAAASLLYGQESLAALLDQAREASGMESVTLRTPLAAAKAAVSCLRSGDIQLTAADQDELLATAEESLDLLTNLVASLLDVSRLQAGALPVFPRPADLKEIIARAQRHRAAGRGGHGRRPGRTAPGHGGPADHGTGHRERDRQRAAVLSPRIAAATDGQRPRRPD